MARATRLDLTTPAGSRQESKAWDKLCAPSLVAQIRGRDLGRSSLEASGGRGGYSNEKRDWGLTETVPSGQSGRPGATMPSGIQAGCTLFRTADG